MRGDQVARRLSGVLLAAANTGTFASRYFADPAAFARDCVAWQPGEALAPHQVEILVELPKRRRVAVRGPHGLGKTAVDALSVWWFALTRDAAGADWKVVTTAGGWRHLTKYLWPEIQKWHRRIRWDVVGRPAPREGRDLLDLSFRGRTGEAFAVASSDAKLIEGAHADEILYILDESKAIPDPTWDAVEGALAGTGNAYALATSTPESPSGRFYDIHARRPGLEDWWPRHVSLEETIASGRISRAWAEQRRRQWGEKSPIYQNRVLGEFSSGDSETAVIPLAWIEEAVERWRDWRAAGGRLSEQTSVGVDVGGGGDATVLARRHTHIVPELLVYPKGDTMETAGRVVQALARGGRAIVDSIGIGAGVLHRLREQKVRAIAFSAGSRSERSDVSGELRFANLRAEAWWGMRERLDPSLGAIVCLPDDDVLVGELAAPTWRTTSNGSVQIESKDDIRQRIGRSTDRADAVVQAFWAGATTAEIAPGSVVAGEPDFEAPDLGWGE